MFLFVNCIALNLNIVKEEDQKGLYTNQSVQMTIPLLNLENVAKWQKMQVKEI